MPPHATSPFNWVTIDGPSDETDYAYDESVCDEDFDDDVEDDDVENPLYNLDPFFNHDDAQ